MKNRPPVFNLPDDEPTGGDTPVPPNAEDAAPDAQPVAQTESDTQEQSADQNETDTQEQSVDQNDSEDEAKAEQESTPDDAPKAEDQAEQAIDAAQQAAEKLAEQNADSTDTSPVDLPKFQSEQVPNAMRGIDLLSQVDLNVRIELGRTRMLIEDVLRLNDGSVVELNKLAGDPVDIYVNERHVATGEVLILNETFCVRVSEIFKTRSAEETAAQP